MKAKVNKKTDILEILFFIFLGMPMLNITSIITFSAIIGFVLILSYIVKKKYFLDNYMIIVLLTFAIGELISFANCPDIYRTLSFTFQKLIVLLILYPICKKTIANDKTNKMLKYFLIGCTISAIFVFISSIFKVSIPWISTGFKTHRLIYSGFGPNVIGRMFCLGSLVSFYFLQINKKFNTLLFISLLLNIYAIIQTVSLSCILLLISGVFFIFLSENKGVRKYGMFKIIMFVFLVCISSIIIYKRISFVNSGVDKLIERVMITSKNDITNGRIMRLSNISSSIKEYFIIGIGYGCSNYVVGMTIHFPIIASLIETGIFGFISCISMYFYLLFVGIKKCIINKKVDGLFIISIVFIIGDMFQPNANYLFTWAPIFLGTIYMRGNNEKDI